MIRFIFRLLPRPKRDERGQALPLAAFGIFAMCLGVLATLNLGQAVHQKIKLQNTADSAAYTLAAMEARTFNYIAFLNRAQIAHYNTAMVVQSYMTWVGFHVALYGTAVDLLTDLKQSVDMGASWGTCSPFSPGCPYQPLKPIVTFMAKFARAFLKISKALRDIADRIGHQIVEAMTIFNSATLWQSQFARAVLLNGHILTGMQSYITKMDPDLSFTSGKSRFMNMIVNGALNSIEYYSVWDKASGLNPYVFALPFHIKRVMPSGEYTKHSDADSQDAYKLMAELCHGTRTPQFVSNRRESFPPGGLALLATVMGTKMGQTKFTKDGKMTGAKISAIGTEGNYSMGQYLSSDDYSAQATGFATIGLANVGLTAGRNSLGDAIAAYESKGKHYLYKGGKTSGQLSPDGKGVMPFPPIAGGPTKTMETKDHAPWPGFAPFFKFKPNAERTSDYGQPSTWIFLNKHHKDFQSYWGSHQDGKAPWFSKFSWKQGNKEVRLDTTIGGKRNSYFFEGLNVISRGMAYYHRPDNWNEHPNFFNPYWRARLAPVGQKLQNFWDKYVTSKMTTSSDSAIVKGFVNVLRNAQMDLFTAVITSVITH